MVKIEQIINSKGEISMEISITEAVKDELFNKNQNFRELVQQHQNYEKRLSELAELTYPNDEEQIEESTLKKKKLRLKDEIYEIMQSYTNSH